MTRMTIFTAPKPFADSRIATIQRNALGSWSRLAQTQILVMGDEEGIAAAAADVGGMHVKGVSLNALGTPLISSMLVRARECAKSRILCLTNADMIFFEDLVASALALSARFSRFVMLSRRWDLDVDGELDFTDGWQTRLQEEVRTRGVLHRPAGSDFFVFPREQYTHVPDFAVGRAGWDNWMIFHARQEGWPVIDCTPSAMVVHQNHDYGHLPGGVPHYRLPESDENIRLAGGVAAIRYTLLDATHVFRGDRLVRPSLSFARLLRGVELLLRRVFAALPPAAIEELARPKRWKKRLARLLGRSTSDGRGVDQ